MRKNYMLKLFTVLVIAGVSIGGANASNPTPTSTTIITENSDNWVEVQNENGVKVFFSKVEIDGKSYLKIKFENTILPLINFTWTLSKNSAVIMNQNNSIAEKETEFFDLNNLIPLNENESFDNFSIVINLK